MLWHTSASGNALPEASQALQHPWIKDGGEPYKDCTPEATGSFSTIPCVSPRFQKVVMQQSYHPPPRAQGWSNEKPE